MDDYIPVNEPLLDGNEKNYLEACIDSGWISSEGPFVREFEEKVAARVGRNYGIAVSNGSAALEVALAAMGIGHGDEVILPTFTIISCAAAVVRCGATPVVVDCDPDTWNMRAQQVEDKITSLTKAIMLVHIYGLPVDADPLLALAKKHGLAVIEDAAEMLGQTYKGKPCGGLGHISTFSFYPNKHVTTGEGGMVVVDDPELAVKCRSLRNLCFSAKKRFVHDELGWNMRMSNLQAAVGLAQLERLDAFVARKKHMGWSYSRLLSDVSGLQLSLAEVAYAENIYWVYGVVLDDNVEFDAEVAMRCLAERGVGTRPFFWPMHEQPVFRKMKLFNNVSCPVAERIGRRGFYLPSGLALTDNQIEQVADALREVMR